MSVRGTWAVGYGPWTISTTVILAVALSATSTLAQTLTSSANERGRRLAPDALEVIPPGADYGDTFQGPVDLALVEEHPELAWTPNYAPETETLLSKATNVVFRNDVYSLEFAFKPVRMIEANIQTAAGPRLANVWYLLYRVRYLGGDLSPKVEDDRFGNQVFGLPKAVSRKWVRFIPTFRLQSLGNDSEAQLDMVLPGAKREIALKERVGQPIYDSIEIHKVKIKRSTETQDNAVWGVATWVGIDPDTDFFRVFVTGLTNAQRMVPNNGEIDYRQKTLVLNFSRPGDTIDELKDRIRFGVPAISDSERQKYILSKYGLEERLDYLWVYR